MLIPLADVPRWYVPAYIVIRLPLPPGCCWLGLAMLKPKSTTTSSAVRPEGKRSSTVGSQSGRLSGARFWKKASPPAPSTTCSSSATSSPPGSGRAGGRDLPCRAECRWGGPRSCAACYWQIAARTLRVIRHRPR